MGKVLLIDALGHGCNTAGKYLGNDAVFLPYADGSKNTHKAYRGKINRDYAECLRETLKGMLDKRNLDKLGDSSGHVSDHVLSILDIHKQYFESALSDKLRNVSKIWLHNDYITIVIDSCVTESPKNTGLSIDGVFDNHLPLYHSLEDSLTPENYRGISYVPKGHRNLNDDIVLTKKMYSERKTVVLITGNLRNFSDYERLSSKEEMQRVCTELAKTILKRFKLL